MKWKLYFFKGAVNGGHQERTNDINKHFRNKIL